MKQSTSQTSWKLAWNPTTKKHILSNARNVFTPFELFESENKTECLNKISELDLIPEDYKK